MFTCLALQSRNRISSLLAVNSRRRIGRIRTCLFGGHCGGKWLNLFHQLVHTILNLLPARLDDTSSGESTRVRFLGLLNRYDVPAPVSFPFFPFDSRVLTLITFSNVRKFEIELMHEFFFFTNTRKIRGRGRIQRVSCNTWCYVSVG